jgi:uncharacterized membrane protein
VELFNNFTDPGGPLSMMGRAAHILSGITWIGLLYFFNFVQTPSYAELSDGARSEALRKLTFRALWWFRYAALLTFLFGVLLLGVNSNVPDGAPDYLSGLGGTSIMTGMLFGITMFLNVWGIIWRNQKVVIGSAEAVAAGGSADPNAAAAAKAGARASRCNTFFSIPMLWFMVFTAHGGWFGIDSFEAFSGTTLYWVLVLVTWAFVEASALGFIGGMDNAFNKAVFDKHKSTIIYGFVYLAILYFVGWELILKPG